MSDRDTLADKLSGMVVHDDELTIYRPAAWEVFSREPAGDKWCFGCRKRLPHDWIVEGEPGPSYYDPTARYDCSSCHRDRTAFPGWAVAE